MKKVLICKDEVSNELLEVKTLEETENIKYMFDVVPEIEEIEGKVGKYELDANGQIIINYYDIPKTEVETLQEKQLEQEMLIAELLLMVAGGGLNA